MKKVVHTFVAPIGWYVTEADEHLDALISEWKNSEIGEFTMTHCESVKVIKEKDMVAWQIMHRVVANFDQETYVWYKLKFE